MEESGESRTMTPLPLTERKATPGMIQHLSQLHSMLQCPLCHQMFEEPITLSSCVHSFCMECIDEYSCDNTICPVPGCGMPMSLTGGKDSFRKVNYGLRQAVSSLKVICDNLNRAQDQWWATGSKSAELKDVVLECRRDLGATATAEVGAPSSEHENDRGDDENSNPVAAATSQQKQEEPIDLQAGRKKKARMSFLDDDDDDEDDDYEGDDGSECSDD